MSTLTYDGLTLVLETVEADILRGDRCIETTERVVGIERVVERKLLADERYDASVSSWLADAVAIDGGTSIGFDRDEMEVTDGRVLTEFLRMWGGDNLIDTLDEMNRARLRGERERAERGDL